MSNKSVKGNNREGSTDAAGNMKQGQMMLYDNNKATWQKVYAILTPNSGFCLHATGNRGSQKVCPPVHLGDIKRIYRADPTGAEKVSDLPHMHTVVMVLETSSDLHICRTAEPKGLNSWIKMFDHLLVSGENATFNAHPKFHFTGIDDLRPLRSYFAPQMYTMLFRNRVDPNLAGKSGAGNHAARGGKGSMPSIPKNFKEIGRRASLSAGTPVRGGNLPMRRQPALVPIVTTPSVTPATSKAASPEMAPSVAVTPEQQRSHAVPVRTHGMQPHPTTRAPPNTPAAGLPQEEGTQPTADSMPIAGTKLMIDLTPPPKGVESSPAPSATPASPKASRPQEDNKENSQLLAVDSAASPLREKSPLDVASPNHALNRLNTLQNKTKESDTNTKDDVIANLKKQVESLTRRNIDLQVDNVNTQSRLLDLEEMVTDAQDETSLWKDKFAALQRQMKLTDENVDCRIARLKEEWMLSMQEEVQGQWAAMKSKWQEKEDSYKAEINTLQQVNADLLTA